MKVTLFLILCSYVAGECMPPIAYHKQFNDQYDCFIEGYNQSILKMEEIGREEINTNEIYIRFICALSKEEEPEQET